MDVFRIEFSTFHEQTEHDDGGFEKANPTICSRLFCQSESGRVSLGKLTLKAYSSCSNSVAPTAIEDRTSLGEINRVDVNWYYFPVLSYIKTYLGIQYFFLHLWTLTVTCIIKTSLLFKKKSMFWVKHTIDSNSRRSSLDIYRPSILTKQNSKSMNENVRKWCNLIILFNLKLFLIYWKR